MRLTAMTDYALRLLIYLGQHPDKLCTIAEVAKTYGISEAHLMKVTHQLGMRGWIETVRGKGGGMRLGHMPAQIGVGAVIRDMETDFQLVECFAPASVCALTGHCTLAGALRGALDSFLKHLDAYTLADLLPSTTGVHQPSALLLRGPL